MPSAIEWKTCGGGNFFFSSPLFEKKKKKKLKIKNYFFFWLWKICFNNFDVWHALARVTLLNDIHSRYYIKYMQIKKLYGSCSFSLYTVYHLNNNNRNLNIYIYIQMNCFFVFCFGYRIPHITVDWLAAWWIFASQVVPFRRPSFFFFSLNNKFMVNTITQAKNVVI